LLDCQYGLFLEQLQFQCGQRVNNYLVVQQCTLTTDYGNVRTKPFTPGSEGD